MRPAAGAVLLPIAACAAEQPAPDSGGVIECAIAGETIFVPDCIMERYQVGEGTGLVIRHPDGGFRRLMVGEGGRRIEAADGAERAETKISGDSVEVTVGRDRYRIRNVVAFDEHV